jgi:hypothetical protein
MQQVTHFTSGDDFRGVQLAEDAVVGKIKPIHPGTYAEIKEPGADVVIRYRAILDTGAMGAKLSQIQINEICIGHGDAFRRKCNGVFCRAGRFGQSESLAGWEIF